MVHVAQGQQGEQGGRGQGEGRPDAGQGRHAGAGPPRAEGRQRGPAVPGHQQAWLHLYHHLSQRHV